MELLNSPMNRSGSLEQPRKSRVLRRLAFCSYFSTCVSPFNFWAVANSWYSRLAFAIFPCLRCHGLIAFETRENVAFGNLSPETSVAVGANVVLFSLFYHIALGRDLLPRLGHRASELERETRGA